MKKVPMIVKKILVALAIGLPIVALPLKQSSGVVTNQSTSTTTALGDGATVNYTIGFTFQSNSDVKVFLRDESFAPPTMTEIAQGVGSSKFTITGGDPGITVHMGTAPSIVQRLVIERVMPFTQTVDYVESEAFPAADHEEQMDKQILLLQQIQADVDTKIGLALGSIATAPTFPDPAADRFLVYDHAASDLTVAPSAPPADGEVLKFDGTAWSLFDLDTSLATFSSHISDTANPHAVTAAQVGSATAQWNANKVKGVTVDDSSIANGRVLSFNSGTGNLEYTAPGLPTLANAHLFVGVAGTPTDLAVSGDLTLQNTGAFTVATVGGQVASAVSTSVGLTGAATAVKTNGAIVKRDGSGAAALDVTGNLTGNVTGNVTGALTGNASTATTSTNGSTVATSTNASFFPMFAASSTNSNQPFNLGTGLTFNPSTNNLTTTTFTGALTGHASLDCALGGCTMSGAITGTSLTLSTPLGVASGGTGLVTLTSNGVMVGAGTSTPTFIAPGSNGNVLSSNGTTWTSAAAPVSTTLTTKGDLQTFSTVNARQAVPGDYGQMVPDAAQTTGWRSASYLTKPAAGPARNYIQYSDFENGATTGWTLGTTGTLTNGLPTGTPAFGSGAAGTLSLVIDSSTPNSGSSSLSYVSSAATTAGNMVASSALSLDKSARAVQLSVGFTYQVLSGAANVNASGTSSNSYAWGFYDVTNSAWVPVTGAFCTNQTTGVGQCFGQVQTPITTASFRLAFYNANATAGAATIDLDDFYMGTTVVPRGPPVSDFGSTPWTVTGGSTNATYAGVYRRVGDVAEFQVKISITGTPTAALASFNFPPGLVIDTTKFPPGTLSANIQRIGSGSGKCAGAQIALVVNANSTTSAVMYYQNSTTGGIASITNTAPGTFTNGDELEVYFKAPIVGWSSNTVGSSDSDGRAVVASYYTSANANIGTTQSGNFDTKIYDSHGAVTAAAAGTGTWKFTAPISGTYQIKMPIYFTTAVAPNVLIYKNGALFQTCGNTVGGQNNVACDFFLNANDYFDVRTSSSVTLNGGAPGASTCAIQISRVSSAANVSTDPTVKARYYASATAITGSLATIVWTTKDQDSHSAMSASGFTCPLNGTYSVKTGLALTGTHVLNSAAAIQIQLNGTATTDTTVYAGGAVTTLNPIVSDDIYCPQGGVIRIQALSTATTPSIISNNTKNFISIVRVGN